jgi:predicted nuclease of predicted toxin-antitoxin system
MPAPRTTLDEWFEAEKLRDATLDRATNAFMAMSGPRRKVPLLLDENMEADVLAELRGVEYLKVTVGRAGASDEMVWAEAKRTRQVIVTTDNDFWDDHEFPLMQSPGVIIVSGRNADEKIKSLATAFGLWHIDDYWRKAPYFLDGTKMRASGAGISAKLWTGTEVLVDEIRVHSE